MPNNNGLTADELMKMMEAFRPPRHPGVGPGSDSSTAGMGFIIRILSEIGKPVTSGKLSQESGVSTARIAVLLRKLEDKGYIIRTDDPKDARKTIVVLTEAGKKLNAKKEAEFHAMLQDLIDNIGEERLTEYLKTTQEIRRIVEKSFRDSIRENSEIFGSQKGNNPS